MSNNLGGSNVAPGSASPEVAVNDRFGRVDAALTESLSVDLSTGNKALTLGQLQTAVFLSLEGAAEARTVTLVPCKRVLFTKNRGSADVTIGLGATSIVVAAGSAAVLRTDGSAAGLEVISVGGGSSGGGISEAPDDGKTYGRKNKAWAEVTSGSGAQPFYNPPLAADFTRVTTAPGEPITLVDHPNAGLLLSAQSVAGDRITAYAKAVPTTGDWGITARLKTNLLNANFSMFGIVCVNSAGDQYSVFGHNLSSSGHNSPALAFNNAGYITEDVPASNSLVQDFFRVVGNRTSSRLEFWRSADGAQWTLIGSVPFSTRFSPARVGLGFNQAYIRDNYMHRGSCPYWTQTWA